MALLNKIKSVPMEVFIIFLSAFIILFGYPFLCTMLFPCWIYKQIALKLAQKDPKTGKILDGINGTFAGQNPYLDPLIVIMPCHSLAGKLDVPTVVKTLKEKVMPSSLYPELAQRIVRKYGYHFWYSVDNFKEENHVHYLKPECPNMPITRDELRDLVSNKLGNLPFDSTKSPWEIFVVPNIIDDSDPEIRSVFILRVNHCLMDGYSIFNFTKKFAVKPWKMLTVENAEEKSTRPIKLVQIYKFVMLLMLGPFHFLKMFVFSNDCNQFTQNTYDSEYDQSYHTQCTPVIPDSRLKSVKNAYGVTMSSLVATLCGQATWKCMRKAGISVPKTIHCLISYPLPGHGDVLTNHWSLVRMPIKVDETDPLKTLIAAEREFQSLRNSVKPLIFFYINQFIAMIPLWLRLHSKYITPTTFVLTNFPGPLEPSDICGGIMKYSNMGGKPSIGTPLLFGCFSSSGRFWFDVGGPVCNLPSQDDADFLSQSILDTLADLEVGISANLKRI